jgi:hypothetical protein
LNHLAGQKSPYLLQHAANPVDWFPWTEEAFDKARRDDRPVFLSIGYSTCHWCHVMERESFSDPEVAELMNGAFVSIKVDREERPDLDDHYMQVSLLLTGSGGWPLTILMTPDGQPFFAGTYIPRDAAYGRLGMLELIPRVQELWANERDELLSSADSIHAELGRAASSVPNGFAAREGTLVRAARSLSAVFDAQYGGFGTAPKFPMPTHLLLLLRSWRRTGDPAALSMVERTLTAIRNGGVYDQVGGGFHRYSTDRQWLVPHFEKMLYDQALLSIACAETWQATGKDFYRRTATDTLGYVLRDLSLPDGGFAAAEDADSEGEEGRFYLWTAAELRAALGAGAESFMEGHGVKGTEPCILHRAGPDTAPSSDTEVLLQIRGLRPRPFRDDKLLTDWNGLTVAALARAGAAFRRADFLSAALRAVRFILDRMRTEDFRLLHRYRDGEAGIRAFADDYAFLAWGLVELYEATFEAPLLTEALSLVDVMNADFWDPVNGGYFQGAADGEQRIQRRVSITDGVIPSANSVMLLVLLKLHRLTGEPDHARRAATVSRLYPADAEQNAGSFSFFFSGIDFLLGPTTELVIVGALEAGDTRLMREVLRGRFLPCLTVSYVSPGTDAGYRGLNGRATAYVCRDFTCLLPTNDPEAMLAEIEKG